MPHHTDIQDLLDRYWEGEATLEEERALKAYFASGQADPRFAAEAPFFQALREERALQSPQISLKSAMPAARPVWQRWAAAAAVIGLIAAGGWWMSHQSPDGQSVDVATQLQPPSQPPAAQPPAQPQDAPPALAAEPDSKPQPKINRKPVRHRSHQPLAEKQPEETLDPETQKALQEVRAALALVSSKLNKGRRAAAKNLDQVETLDKFFKQKKETEG
jgi:hypothetical protein